MTPPEPFIFSWSKPKDSKWLFKWENSHGVQCAFSRRLDEPVSGKDSSAELNPVLKTILSHESTVKSFLTHSVTPVIKKIEKI